MTGKVPRLEPRSSGQRTTKVVRQYWSPFFQRWITKSGNQSSGFQSPARRAVQATFTATVKMIKAVSADDRVAVSQLSKNTPFLDRDLLMKAASGLLINWIDDSGTTWVGRRQVYPDIQAALDSISNTPGCMLVRLDEGWLALLPGNAGQVLTMNDDGTVPFWQDSQGGGGGSNGADILMPPASALSGTDTYPGTYYILQPIWLPQGAVVRGGTIVFNATNGSVNWAIGLYDGDWSGPANPLVHSAAQHGCTTHDFSTISFATPYTVLTDGIYWFGAWMDINVSILANPGGYQCFWSNALGDWSDVSPSVSFNGNGAGAVALVTLPAPVS